MRAELASALAVAVLGLAGCSADEPSARPTPTPTPTPTPAEAAFGCDRVSDAELGEWLGVPLEVEEYAADDGGTSCAAAHSGDQLLQAQWAPLTGADTLDVAANRVFADREPVPTVVDTALPGGEPARMVVTEVPGTQIQVDLVALAGGVGLHVIVSAGDPTGRIAAGRARLVDAAARIAEAYVAAS